MNKKENEELRIFGDKKERGGVAMNKQITDFNQLTQIFGDKKEKRKESKMTTEKDDELSDEMKALLESLPPEKLKEVKQILGQSRKTPTRKEKVSVDIPPEYYVTYHFKCRLCQTQTYQHFQMVQDKRLGGLVSKKVDEIPQKVDASHVNRETVWCACCKESLMKLEKVEVVERVLDYIKQR